MAHDSLKQQEVAAILALCRDNLDELLIIYNQLSPDSTYAEINEFPLFEEFNTPNVSGDKCAAALVEAAQSDVSANNLRDFSLAISSSYSFEAMNSAERGNLLNAWRCLAEARYFCGSYSVNPGLVGARRRAQKEGRQSVASSGGSVKAFVRYGEVKNALEQYVREKRPPGLWKTRTEAINKINEVFYNGEKGFVFSWCPATTTLDKWLKEMPDAELCFQKRGKRKKAAAASAFPSARKDL